MSIKVFIVDDHFMVIEGIRALLQNEKQIDLLGYAMTADSCLTFLKREQPDVILMDISLPDKGGIDLCREVKTLNPDIRVIGLSTFDQQSFIDKMVRNGASGYLLKNVTKRELLDAIEAVMKGKSYLSREAALALRQPEENDMPSLTRREKEVLELIAAGLTNGEIAEKLFVSTTTIDTHRKNLLLKLNARNTAELIKIAVVKKIIT